jgi:pseudouridine synthase
VDGEVVTAPGAQVEEGRARIEVDGRRVEIEPLVHILLNKPLGPISTARDVRGRKTVVDLVKGVKGRLYPAGRLDADTEGVLLLTNDGGLTHRLTHPRYGVEKVYRAEVAGMPSAQALRRLAAGMLLEEGPTGPARVRVLRAGKERSVVEIGIFAGRKRQVRRMLKAVGHPVLALRRIRMGPLEVGDLKPGEWRLLGEGEVAALWDYVEKAAGREKGGAREGRREAAARPRGGGDSRTTDKTR